MDYKRVLRLHYVNGFSGRAIAESTGDGKTAVNDFLKRFRENDVLSWPLSDDVTNELIRYFSIKSPVMLPVTFYTGDLMKKLSIASLPGRVRRSFTYGSFITLKVRSMANVP